MNRLILSIILVFSSPVFAETLLHIIYGGFYPSVIPGQYLGDDSSYAENRFIVHKNIPSSEDQYGGITFTSANSSYVAINDSFMAGREEFGIYFFFYVASANPTSGTLMGSNWATPNDGDWLLQFSPEGKLSLMLQYGNTTYNYAGTTTSWATATRFSTRVEKNGTSIKVYVNDTLEIDGVSPQYWLENGVPLAFGGNTYDRTNGMDYFSGTIGGITIESEL